eukprot:scaffold89184_cov32-Tisochrysis_lutea.AAC.2
MLDQLDQLVGFLSMDELWPKLARHASERLIGQHAAAHLAIGLEDGHPDPAGIEKPRSRQPRGPGAHDGDVDVCERRKHRREFCREEIAHSGLVGEQMSRRRERGKERRRRA